MGNAYFITLHSHHLYCYDFNLLSRGKFYYLQLFMGSILFFKFLTEFINIMIHGLLLSIFITPILLLMLIAIIVAYSYNYVRSRK